MRKPSRARLRVFPSRRLSRPRTISDADILAAAARVIGEVGPSRLTLARVAAAAGVSPATLVQRFGSRRALMLHLAGSASAEAQHAVARARGASSSPLAAARRVLESLADLAARPAEMANHLAFLQVDLTDPEFHRLARRQSLEQERLLRALLEDAMAADELCPGDAGRLARTLLTVTNGSLLRWAIVRKGSATRWLRYDLDAVLAPWIPTAAAKARV